MAARIRAAEEYLKNLIELEFDSYDRGVWIGLVRSTFNDTP